jgi:hypothetical protein
MYLDAQGGNTEAAWASGLKADGEQDQAIPHTLQSVHIGLAE